MVQPLDISISESHDIFDWDESEVRDLVRTTPLRYDDDGLPVGLQIVAPPQREDRLLSFAAAFEAGHDFAARVPFDPIVRH